jgi:hypothetical protein
MESLGSWWVRSTSNVPRSVGRRLAALQGAAALGWLAIGVSSGAGYAYALAGLFGLLAMTFFLASGRRQGPR